MCYFMSTLCRHVQTEKKHTTSYYFSTTSLESSVFNNPIRGKIIDGVPRSSLGLMCVSRVLSKLTHKLSDYRQLSFEKYLEESGD